MFKQKSKLEKVEKALCEKDAQTGVCSGDGPGAQQAQPQWATVPGCGGGARCQQTLCAIDPADSSCAGAGFSFSGAVSGTNRGTGDISSEDMSRRLSQIYSPQGII